MTYSPPMVASPRFLVLLALLASGCDRREPRHEPSAPPPPPVEPQVRTGAFDAAPAVRAADAGPAIAAPEVAVDGGVTDEADVGDAADGPLDKHAGGKGIEMISQGAEPRFALRYAIPAGAKQGMEMTAEISGTVPQVGEVQMPIVTIKLDTEVMRVADGNTTARLVVSGYTVSPGKATLPGLVEQIREQLGDIKGATTTVTIDATGKLIDIKLGVDDSADPMLREALGQSEENFGQIFVRMPDIEVGKGAKWKTRRRVSENGINVDVVTVFEILAATATTAKLKSTMTKTAPKQQVGEGEMTATVEKFKGKAAMTIDMNLTKMVPKIDGTSDQTMTISAMGQSAEIVSKTKLRIRAR
jgi:hypothetical protein